MTLKLYKSPDPAKPNMILCDNAELAVLADAVISKRRALGEAGGDAARLARVRAAEDALQGVPGT